MSKQIHMVEHTPLRDFLQFAEIVRTDQGNSYYRVPFWIQRHNGLLILHENPPEDLSEFITKAGLGNPNPQIIKPEL
jgi:hypothetical protein